MRANPLANLKVMKTKCPIKEAMRERSFAKDCSELGRRSAQSRRRRKNYGWTEKVDVFDSAHIEPPLRPAAAIMPPPSEGKLGRQPEVPSYPLTNKKVERFDAGMPAQTAAPAAFRPGFPDTEMGDEDEPAIEFWDGASDPAEDNSTTAPDGGLPEGAHRRD